MQRESPSPFQQSTRLPLISRIRAATGISQEELALRAGVDRGYMGGIERGESNAAILKVVRIAAAMNLAASELLEQAGL